MNYDVIIISVYEKKKRAPKMISTYIVETENGNFMRVSQMNWAMFIRWFFSAPKAMPQFDFSPSFVWCCGVSYMFTS